MMKMARKDLHMVIRENIFGDDLLDIMTDSEAERVGQRMRKYRELKGITQAELGKMVELPADRIQKYENGVRKPKNPLLKDIASSLDVSSLALVDPTPSSYINTMYVLFELEEKYGIDIEYSDKSDSYTLTIDRNNELYDYVKPWFALKHNTEMYKGKPVSDEKDVEEIEKAVKKYTMWKANYPHPITDKEDVKNRKKEIEEQIELYKKELKELDELL